MAFSQMEPAFVVPSFQQQQKLGMLNSQIAAPPGLELPAPVHLPVRQQVGLLGPRRAAPAPAPRADLLSSNGGSRRVVSVDLLKCGGFEAYDAPVPYSGVAPMWPAPYEPKEDMFFGAAARAPLPCLLSTAPSKNFVDPMFQDADYSDDSTELPLSEAPSGQTVDAKRSARQRPGKARRNRCKRALERATTLEQIAKLSMGTGGLKHGELSQGTAYMRALIKGKMDKTVVHDVPHHQSSGSSSPRRGSSCSGASSSSQDFQPLMGPVKVYVGPQTISF
eukprot:TRINITY_DN35901_c0_g1_i1.p1 TRINITY_DN35901_c0_g1~~TRINITY_DN35901_c0_g1_i1.p1  ORF type:complete len:278 (-),score=60.89 TRINITY_DN35901_c0_g1_i1:533-1366(-)